MIFFKKKRVRFIATALVFSFFGGANLLQAETDSDQDGLPDSWELEYGLNPADPSDAESDSDQDSLTALQEFELKTNPAFYDTQGFGLSDSLLLGLQGYYPLNETESIVAFDQTPYQRHGFVYEGGKWNSQIGVGGALELNNTLGYLHIDGGLIHQQTNVTISLLFRTQHPGKQMLVNAGSEQSMYEILGYLWQSDYLWFISGINGFTDWHTDSLADNQWHRIAFVRNATDQSLSVWVDDHLVGQANRPLGPLNIAPNGFIFGRGAWGWTTYGEFDEVRIYNRALKPEELQELYKKSDMDKDGLADYWELKNFGSTMVKEGNEDDADLDGMSDTWELEYGLNPADPMDAASDEDQDSLTALQEFQLQTSPLLYDTYGYGMSDSLLLGLQGYYPLNETEGIVAYDQSAYQRDGSLHEGGVWKPEAGVGGALSLNNTYGYLQLNGDLVDAQNNVTISFLLKTQHPGKQMLFNAVSEKSVYELVSYLWESDYLWWISGVEGFTDWPITSLADDQWHRLTFIRDGSAQKLKVWVDDQLIGDVSRSIVPLNVSSNGFLFGRGSWGWPTFAEFDEVRIYNRALKAAEVQELYSKSDMDQDGLPDSWELKYFGNSLDQSGWDDPDGDGKSNQEEQQQGTDPNDYYEGFSPTLTIASGNQQKGAIAQLLAQPLVVKVEKEGQPMANAPVTFTVLSGGGKLSIYNDKNYALHDMIEIKSDAQGLARIYYKQALDYNTASTIQAQANQSSVEFQATTLTYEESDSDNDGMLDPWENTYGLNPLDDTDCLQDLDGDRIPNVYEFANNTLPNDKDSFPAPHHIVDPVNGANSPNDNIYKTITEAISKASAQTNVYSVIFVKEGVYNESIRPNKKRVLLLGELGKSSLPILATKQNTETFKATDSNDSRWGLDGFIITHVPGYQGSAVMVQMKKEGMGLLSHCLIRNNESFDLFIAGVHMAGGRLWINHCTIAENRSAHASSAQGIYAWFNSEVFLQNSIVWNETEGGQKQISLGGSVKFNVTNSIILGGEQGALAVDPQLTPYHRLKAGSPARDAGANLVVSRWDWDNEWRSAPVDIGVDEFVDNDGDSMADAWETEEGLDKNNPADANGDSDGDGLINLGEYEAGTNPQLADSDGDGLKDGEEVNLYQTDPLKVDTDGDDMSDGYEIAQQLNPLDKTDKLEDRDGDRIPNVYEFANNTSPNDAQSFPQPHYIVDQVNGTNSPDDTIYSTVQQAVSAAPTVNAKPNQFTIIKVLPGNYTNKLSIGSRRILLLGESEGKYPPVLSSHDYHTVVNITHRDVVLDGFIIERHLQQAKSVGLEVNIEDGVAGDELRVVNCLIRNHQKSFGAINAVGPGTLNLVHCTLWNNEGVVGGAWLSSGIELNVKNCIIWNEKSTNELYLGSSQFAVNQSLIRGGEGGGLDINPKLYAGGFLGTDSVAALNQAIVMPVAQVDFQGESRTNLPDIGADEFVDSDNDGLPDWWEKLYGFNPDDPNDATTDTDLDELTNLDEFYLYNTDHTKADTDGDMLKDGEEINTYKTDPLNTDTDGDGMPDGWEVKYGFDPLTPSANLDHDEDGLSDYEEYLLQQTYGETLDPTNPDSNGDSIYDKISIELNIDPTDQDLDDDGLSNSVELEEIGTSPFLADTDGDGINDKDDAFPLDPNQSQLPPGDPQDEEAPIITLKEPENAVLIF